MSNPLETSEAWERQPGERNLWFSRFELFRLLGPDRSLLGVVNAQRQAQGARPIRSIPQAWAKNAKRWRWRERAEAWDLCQRREARQAHAHAMKEMNSRHIQEAQALQSKAIQCLKSLDVAQIPPAALPRFIVYATNLERLARGESQQEVEEANPINQAGDATPFSVEDAVASLRELEEFRRAQFQQRGDQTAPDGGLQVP